MKMWSISVAPMPSMMRMPVSRSHAWNTGSGSVSPALTHLRSVAKASPAGVASIRR